MASSNGRKNPYFVGPPNEELFFVRKVLFDFIENRLRQNVKVIMLYGQRRIGKSSVLKQIPKFFAQKEEFKQFIFVNFDFQDKASFPLSQVLHNLAQEILEHLYDLIKIENYDLTVPTTKDEDTVRLQIQETN